MANEYQKINTLFLRDENNIIIPDKFTCPEFNYLKDCLWECTEQIDGSNIHIDFITTKDSIKDETCDGWSFDAYICGRTEKTQIPAHLQTKLEELFCPCVRYPDDYEFQEAFDEKYNDAFEQEISEFWNSNETTLCTSIYGEGYGAKIQNGGNYIKDDVGFVLFDVKVGERWLSREACERIAAILGVPIVPIIGYFTIPEAIEYVRKGFKSAIAENPDYDAEGLVLKTPRGLRFRDGERIIAKIKTYDFQEYRAKYGDGPVEQTPNPKYDK